MYMDVRVPTKHCSSKNVHHALLARTPSGQPVTSRKAVIIQTGPSGYSPSSSMTKDSKCSSSTAGEKWCSTPPTGTSGGTVVTIITSDSPFQQEHTRML